MPRKPRVLLCVGGPLAGQVLTTTTHAVHAIDPEKAIDGPLSDATCVYMIQRLHLFEKEVTVLVDMSLDESERNAALARQLFSTDGLAAFNRGDVIEHDRLEEFVGAPGAR